jgi:phosphoserine phosphatase RsbU/P
MRILIAEDDVTSRKVLVGVLTRSGDDVVETVDGAAAWAVLQQPAAPRLAILDWMMPELDGVEVVRRVRARASATPPYLILLTTRGETADIIAGLAAGADDYLTKPWDAGELRARVAVGRRLVETQGALAATVEELRQALAQITTLRGILPICAHCKKIRDDQGYWSQVETYISRHSDAQFSHSICPACMTLLYPEYVRNDATREEQAPGPRTP